MTSDAPDSRPISDFILRSSGVRLSIGESVPCSTWYTPSNAPVFSIAATSLGYATTHIFSGLRDAHSSHTSRSVKLPQTEHSLTLDLTSRSAAQNASTSSSVMSITAYAYLSAVLRPTPGRAENLFASAAMLAISFIKDRRAERAGCSLRARRLPHTPRWRQRL